MARRNIPGLNFKLPFQRTGDGSYFAMNRDSRSAVRDNIINLLLTNPGERLMFTDFGAGIRGLLFEQMTQDMKLNVADRIKSSVGKYMSFVSIVDLRITTKDEEPDLLANEMKVFVRFTYTFNNNIFDEVTVKL